MGFMPAATDFYPSRAIAWAGRLARDDELLAIELDLRTAVLPKQHAITGLDVGWTNLAVGENFALTNGDHPAFGGFLSGGCGNQNAPRRALLGVVPFQHDPVMKRTNVHGAVLLSRPGKTAL